MLSTAYLRTTVTAGDDAHALDAFWHAHVGIEYLPVGGEVHPSDVVGREGGVLQLNPRFALTELIQNARGVVGEHLVESDVLSALAEHRGGAGQQKATKQDFEFIHFFVVLLYI